MSERTAIEVTLDGPPTPAWQARALSGLRESENLEVAAVRLLGARRRRPLRALTRAVECHVFRIADPLVPVAVDPAEATGAQPSAVLWLSERPPPACDDRELLRLRHNGAPGTSADAFARAALCTTAVVETELLAVRGTDTFCIARTVSGVRAYSPTLSHALALWKLAALVPRELGRAELSPAPADPDRESPSSPSPRRMFLRLVAAICRVAVVRTLYRRSWRIRVRARADVPTQGWEHREKLVDWGDAELYADPFLIEHDGRHHLFCEEVRARAPGMISHTELARDGSPARPPRCVMRAPHHLSYPFVFAHEGDIFMIPETVALRRLELYRAVDFPTRWEREAVLLDDLTIADATIVAHDGRLWLFASVAAPNASLLDELHVYWASEPAGPWQPHARNPVVSDVRCARPAGAIQRWDGRLVRPGQDGSRRYGGAITFREIERLTTTEYAEREIDRIDPDAVVDARATHSYASDVRFEAIDLRRRELRLRRRRSSRR
ncbi:MAG TPA: hypothetical protein VFW29_05150 [Solirubrobacteraceae bacterium]|nr:hypothetical protein [Solirubrobacteraceae bacterium]